MLRFGFLWFQLVAGMSIFGEHVFHIKLTKERGFRQIWGLLIGALLAAISVLELFLLDYNVIPEIALWPTLLLLDVVAVLLYLARPEALPWASS